MQSIKSSWRHVNSQECEKPATSHHRHRSLEGRFTKRIVGLDRFIPKAHLRDTYLVMLETISLETRTSFTGVEDMARRRGVDSRTFRRHQRELAVLGVVIITARKAGCRSNYTNRYTFPLLNEDFWRSRLMSGGGVNRVRVKPLLEIKEQTTAGGADAPRQIEPVWRPDPERPKPDPEVIASRQLGRTLRMQQRQAHAGWGRKASVIHPSEGSREWLKAVHAELGTDPEAQHPDVEEFLRREGFYGVEDNA